VCRVVELRVNHRIFCVSLSALTVYRSGPLFLVLVRAVVVNFFCSSRRRHTRSGRVTGVQTCALPIYFFDRWRLKSMPNNLYKPEWEYNFSPDKVNFLLGQIKGEGRLMMYIGKNNFIETYEGWLIQIVNNYGEVEIIINDLLSK